MCAIASRVANDVCLPAGPDSDRQAQVADLEQTSFKCASQEAALKQLRLENERLGKDAAAIGALTAELTSLRLQV